MSFVDLKAIKTQARPLNEVDLHLIRVASGDGDSDRLDENDFVRGASAEQVDRFLKASERYLTRRLLMGPEDQQGVTDFYAVVTGIDLPPQYTVVSPSALQTNPTQVARFMRGRLTGYAVYNANLASGSVMGQDVSIVAHQYGLGLKLMWPLDAPPAIERKARFSLGFISTVTQADGSMSQGDTRLADVGIFGASLALAGEVLFPIKHWFDINMNLAVGFEGGRYGVSPTDQGKEALGDPCSITTGDLLGDPDKATGAIECRFKTAIAGYTTFPIGLSVGFRFLQRLNLDLAYQYARLDASDVILGPRDFHRVGARLGVDFY